MLQLQSALKRILLRYISNAVDQPPMRRPVLLAHKNNYLHGTFTRKLGPLLNPVRYLCFYTVKIIQKPMRIILYIKNSTRHLSHIF